MSAKIDTNTTCRENGAYQTASSVVRFGDSARADHSGEDEGDEE